MRRNVQHDHDNPFQCSLCRARMDFIKELTGGADVSRNVERLRELVHDYAKAGAAGSIADYLAARGVLAVDSLTDEQAQTSDEALDA
jgi:hypothetical protein